MSKVSLAACFCLGCQKYRKLCLPRALARAVPSVSVFSSFFFWFVVVVVALLFAWLFACLFCHHARSTSLQLFRHGGVCWLLLVSFFLFVLFFLFHAACCFAPSSFLPSPFIRFLAFSLSSVFSLACLLLFSVPAPTFLLKARQANPQTHQNHHPNSHTQTHAQKERSPLLPHHSFTHSFFPLGAPRSPTTNQAQPATQSLPPPNSSTHSNLAAACCLLLAAGECVYVHTHGKSTKQSILHSRTSRMIPCTLSSSTFFLFLFLFLFLFFLFFSCCLLPNPPQCPLGSVTP